MPQEVELEYRTWMSSTGSLESILPIMERSHGRALSLDWLTLKLSWGLGGVAGLAYDGDEAVGIVLFGAAPYELFGSPANVALSYDTFVDSRYRGRGLFRSLLGLAEAECKAQGFDMLLNFPNDASRPGFIKAGWNALSPMRRFVNPSIPLNPVGLFDRIGRLVTDRNQSFGPDSSSMSSVVALPEFRKDVADEKYDLQHSLAPEALSFRFSPMRGEGYRTFLSAGTSTVLRIGSRGQVREVQILATSPRALDARSLRAVTRGIKAAYPSDIVTFLESSTSHPINKRRGGGFLMLGSSTTPFYKNLALTAGPATVSLSGLDIHTW